MALVAISAKSLKTKIKVQQVVYETSLFGLFSAKNQLKTENPLTLMGDIQIKCLF
jgi:hypothetical protein